MKHSHIVVFWLSLQLILGRDICFQRKIGYFWPDYVQWKEFFGGMQKPFRQILVRPVASGDWKKPGTGF